MIWLIVLAELIFLLYAAVSRAPYYLRRFTVLNMILITLFAPRLIEVGGMVTNVGTIFYSAVMVSQLLIFHLFGKEEVTHTIRMVLWMLLGFVGISGWINMLPVVQGNESYAAAMSAILSFPPAVVFASFFAFVIGQSFVIRCMASEEKRKPTIVFYSMCAIMAQIVDSVIFFPLAFGSFMPITEIPSLMLAGIAAKGIFMAIIGAPISLIVYSGFFKREHQG